MFRHAGHVGWHIRSQQEPNLSASDRQRGTGALGRPKSKGKELLIMQRLKVLVLAIVAALAMTAVATATASAALPEFSGPFAKSFTSKSGTGTLETVGK